MRPIPLRLLPRVAAPAAAAALVLVGGLAPASAAGTQGWRAVFRVAETAGSQTQLTSVVATGPANAWAAGFTCPNGPCVSSATLVVEQWAHGAWQPAPTTGMPSPAPSVGLGAVVGASSAKHVWVFAPTSGFHPSVMAFHWNGTTWSRATLPSWFFGGSNPLAVKVAGSRVWVFSLFRTVRHPFAAFYNGTTWSKVALKVDPTAVSALSGRDIWLTGLIASTAKAAAPATAGPAFSVVPGPAPGTTAGRFAAGLSPGAAASRRKLAEAAEHWNGHSWRVVRMPSPYLPSKEVYIPLAAAATSARSLLVQGVATTRRGSRISQSLLRWNGRRWSRVRLPVKDGIDLFLGAMAQDGHGGAWLPALDLRSSGLRVWLDHYSRGHWTRAASPRYHGRRTSADALAWIPGTRSLWAVGAAGSSHGWGVILKNGS